MSTLEAAQIIASLTGLLSGGGSPANLEAQIDQTIISSNGIGVASTGLIWYSESLSIVSGTPFTLNLLTGLDPLGNALAANYLIAWLLENDATAGNLVMGGGTHPILGTDQATVQPASAGTPGFKYGVEGSGIAVVSGSADTLKITASTGTIPAKLTILLR